MKKLYYSITEVGKEVDEETHILRYWEKEFEQLNPRKNAAGNRIYTEEDIAIVREIKKLIRDEKLSLSGAKERMHNFDKKNKLPFKSDENENNISKENLIELKNILKEISDLLKS